MLLNYPNKKSEQTILDSEGRGSLKKQSQIQSASKLIKGDNLQVLKCLLYDYDYRNKIDLVYIDPPFATNNTFKIGSDRANSISASHLDATAYTDELVGSEFIEFLRERLILLREVMSDNASIYLHIDYKIGHYVKIIMDEVFGTKNFRNDIARIKCNPKNFGRKAYGNIKDLILFYTKTDSYIWNEPRADLFDSDIERLFKKIDENGKRYTTVPLHAPGETKDGPTGKSWRGMPPPKGRHWRSDPKVLDELDKAGLIEWSANGVPRKKIYAEDAEAGGKKIQDIWEYKDPQYPTYPTEKNIELIELIISTSSDENSLVMDCFSGSGTTLVAANRLHRKWIGIDQSEQAIEVSRKKLDKLEASFFASSNYEYWEWETNPKAMETRRQSLSST